MAMIEIENLSKTFHLHTQGSARIDVMRDLTLRVDSGECVALTGRSGAGKSTLMRMIYGNYLAAGGSLRIAGTDVVTATPHEILRLRRETMGYVSQFLRVIPRVPTIDVVAEPLLALGTRRHRPRPGGASAHPAEPAGTALAVVAHDVLGGRTAAGEHRAGLCA